MLPVAVVQITTSLKVFLTFPALEHLRYAFVAPAVWFMAKMSANKQSNTVFPTMLDSRK